MNDPNAQHPLDASTVIERIRALADAGALLAEADDMDPQRRLQAVRQLANDVAAVGARLRVELLDRALRAGTLQ